ncbi:thioredoxin, mitochondrial [Lingula anatina]|uniref:Thioredoxin, mitochondrial n=1 Tax=Lingula anatina TaxID=7574 RepID=A0A1S3K5U4_LINAN|nr:thioredoxin, mitochondrial [Lingula anatina]|eukprot:XP_013417621.1 thioredoxin, mitochondrial [Lingula anatina]
MAFRSFLRQCPGLRQSLCSRLYIATTRTAQNNGSLLTKQTTTCRTQIATISTSMPKSGKEYMINIQDDEHFKQDVLKKSEKLPVIVDFHAGWCGPCKLLAPRLESLVAAEEGKVLLAKVDIDEMSDIAINYGVTAVPTVVAIKNGQSVDKFMGLVDDDIIQSFIRKLY